MEQKKSNTKWRYDFSAIVLTYNSDWTKLKKTVLSMLAQKGVSIQVIVADDGSVENYSNELKSLFQEMSFTEYIIVDNPMNQGTVKNFYSGLLRASGKYIKAISPGDYLVNDDSLYGWFCFMERGQYDCSFCEAVYYQIINGETRSIIRKHGNPIFPEMYKSNTRKSHSILFNCFVLEDYILGASYVCKTDILFKYVKLILDRVIYLEDAAYRIMMLDGIRTIYYKGTRLMYEFGTGVSTSKKARWVALVDKDKQATEDVIIEHFRGGFSDRLCHYYKHKRNKHQNVIRRNLRIVQFFPEALFWKPFRWICIRMGLCKTHSVNDCR